jgi:hypothetical protein
MKKILFLINGPFIRQQVINTAIAMAKSTSSFLHTYFLNSKFQLEDYNYPFPNDLSLTRNRLTGKTLAEENSELFENNISIFKDECENAKVDYVVDQATEVSLAHLIKQSAFSDLILTDGKTDHNHYHLVDILVSAHCPVYLVSNEIETLENVILAYDGSYSSIKAIKMFSYIFPELQNLPHTLIHIASEKSEILPSEESLTLWTEKHFSNLETLILHGDPLKELVELVNLKSNSLIVLGAYGRSSISRLFHKSMANTVIAQTKSPLFISHE